MAFGHHFHHNSHFRDEESADEEEELNSGLDIKRTSWDWPYLRREHNSWDYTHADGIVFSVPDLNRHWSNHWIAYLFTSLVNSLYYIGDGCIKIQ